MVWTHSELQRGIDTSGNTDSTSDSDQRLLSSPLTKLYLLIAFPDH